MFFGLVKGDSKPRQQGQAIRSVLVVEDEPLVAFDNEHVLEQAGYRVAATVDDYDHAIRVIEQDEVDLVIADITLHGDKTGIDVARHAYAKGLAVLFVSGSCPVDAHEMAVGCLAKPYLPRELLASIGVIEALMVGADRPRVPRGLHLFDDAG
ncbi:response regulator [Sphingobium sp. TomMM35A]